jgi:hypothetical protein
MCCSQLEMEKNKLDNLLNNNLLKKLDRMQADMQEMTSEERRRRLDLATAELESVNRRIDDNTATFKGNTSQLLLHIARSWLCHLACGAIYPLTYNKLCRAGGEDGEEQ